MKNILVTGGRGFIGFNALQSWKKNFPEMNFVCLDAETYADKFLIEEKNKWLAENKIKHCVLDLSSIDADLVLHDLIRKNNIDAIVHFAAESHVDNSIKNPNVFFQSNIIGTVSILNAARAHDLRVHIVSTDEVYGETTPESWNVTVPDGRGHALLGTMLSYENMPLKPSSPYSSSKASADMIALSYHRTFGSKVTVSRCTNNAGKWQMFEKLIPTVICKALKNQKIPVYGNGLQKRHWINVDEHNKFVMDVLQNGEYGKIYNFAPCDKNYLTNIDIIKFILDYLKKPYDLIEHVTDRLGHDVSYYLVSEKHTSPQTFSEFMPEVIDWYVEKFK